MQPTPTKSPQEIGPSRNWVAEKTILAYLVAGGLWVILLNFFLVRLVDDPVWLRNLQTTKDALFVGATALLLYLYLRLLLRRQQLADAEFLAIQSCHSDALAQFEQFATLFDSLHAIIYVADLDTYELLYVNRFAEEIFGKDWRDRKCFDFFQEGQDHECLFCTNLGLLTNGQPGPPITWEFCNTRNKRWYQCLDKCIPWTDGRLARLEIALDITARKEMEQTKEELLSAISHEMRTPLTAITGFTELLLEEEGLSDHVRQYIDTIFKESEKMTDLVNTFLELRRLKADQSRTNYEDINVKLLLERGIKNARECAKQHQPTVHCPDDLQVFGNRKELGQVVAKLLSNACRFSPQGGAVNLHAWRENDEVILRFEDSGIGIPPEEHQHIFEHFHRLDRGNRRRTSGAGLGLSLVKETVALHGGRVWVESQTGRGSRFYVALPCHSARQPQQQGPG